MMFKNSIKLFVANFSVFWKLLLYKLIAISVCILLLIPVMSAWAECFNSVDFLTLLTNLTSNTVFGNMSLLLNNLFILVDAFVKVLGLLFAYNTFAFFYSIVVVGFILPFLFRLSSIPTGEGLYSYMASLSKSNFVAVFISKIGTSAKYSLFRTLLDIPVFAVISVCMYYLLSLTTMSGIIQIFLPIIIIVLLVFFVALWLTVFCGWMPATVVFNVGVRKSFKKGIKAVSRRFFRLFSSVIVIIFLATMLSVMFTTFSLIALIPVASVSIVMLEMVMFFESQGMRYYVDLDSIVSPKKLEQCDNLNKVKNII